MSTLLRCHSEVVRQCQTIVSSRWHVVGRRKMWIASGRFIYSYDCCYMIAFIDTIAITYWKDRWECGTQEFFLSVTRFLRLLRLLIEESTRIHDHPTDNLLFFPSICQPITCHFFKLPFKQSIDPAVIQSTRLWGKLWSSQVKMSRTSTLFIKSKWVRWLHLTRARKPRSKWIRKRGTRDIRKQKQAQSSLKDGAMTFLS